MSKELKGLIIKEFKEHFSNLDECIVIGLQGIEVEKSNRLRSSLREDGTRMMVVKNSLACLALKETERESIATLLEGPSAFLFEGNGIVPIAKKIRDWTKENEDIFVRGGYLNGDLLTPEEVKRLSTIPSREVLLSQVLSGITSPASNFLNLLTAKFRDFAQCLHALKEKMSDANEKDS